MSTIHIDHLCTLESVSSQYWFFTGFMRFFINLKRMDSPCRQFWGEVEKLGLGRKLGLVLRLIRAKNLFQNFETKYGDFIF